MTILDYLFFGIYNSYYKDGNYKNDMPWYNGMAIFLFTFWCNIITILDVLNSSKNKFPVEKLTSFIIAAVCLIISYLLFVRNRRYDTIYNRYKNFNKTNRIINKVVSWTYVIGSIVAIMLPPVLRMFQIKMQ